jgi:signal transduction histidine kinase
MRLALKFVLAFTLGNVLLAAVYGYWAVRREVRLFQHTASVEAESLGRAMEDMLADAWRRSGHQGVLQVVRKVNQRQERELRVRWVWFDARPGDPYSPSVSPERLTTVTIEQHQAVEALDPDGAMQLDIYWPVALGAERRGGLEFAHAMTELQDNQREIVQRTVLLIGGMALLSGLLAAALGVRLVGQPLRALMEKTRLISAGNLQGPIRLGTRDELAELGESLNLMCEQLAQSQGKIREETATRIAAMEQLRHADRLKTVGRMASGIAHELGTPLSVVAGRAGLIGSGKLTADEVAESAAAIKAESDKMTKIIRQLLDFARASTPHKTAVDLRQVVGQTVDLLRPLAEKRHVQLRLAAGGDPAIAEIDAGQIQQVLTNLIVNAVEAMPGGGKAEITVRSQTACPPDGGDARPSRYYAVEVRDEGVGIAEEHLWRLFEPFFTTKEVGEGTGLGLSIAYGMVQEHGGWIDVTSRPGAGSCFVVFLPAGAKP